MAYLQVVPQTAGEPPARYELVDDRTTIGRGAGCRVRLHDRMVGRIHAEIRQYGDVYLLEDLRTRSGTRARRTVSRDTPLARAVAETDAPSASMPRIFARFVSSICSATRPLWRACLHVSR